MSDNPPPLHLGLTPWVGDLAGAADLIPDQAATAESMGYESLWLPESHFVAKGSCPNPLLILAAAAARTSTLGLGTTSYLLPIRNALQVAEDVAILDRISGGRVILGLGRGFRRALFEAFEVPPAEKRDRFEAALRVMKQAWSGAALPTNGDEPKHLSPLPVQQPHPPLWVAAFGPKALTQAGRLGLPYLASPMESFDRLSSNYQLHREMLVEHGNAVDLPVPIMRTLFISPSSDSLRRVREALEAQLQELRASTSTILRRRAELAVEDWALVGSPAQVTDEVARYREELGMTHLIVRGSVPGAQSTERLRSLEALLEALV